MHVDVKKEIYNNSFADLLLSIRMNILDDKEVVVPANLFEFFSKYSFGVKLGYVVLGREEIEIPNISCSKPICIMSGGGAESSFMELNFGNGVDIIKGDNFHDYNQPHYKREFQLGLLGMALDYKCTLIGIGSLGTHVNSFMYEYTEDFFNLWNNTFPSKIYSPIRLMDKDVIYSMLLERGIEFNWCDNSVNGVPCGSCWSCLEACCIFYCFQVKKIAVVAKKRYFDLEELGNKYNEILANPEFDPCDTNAMVLGLQDKYNVDFGRVLFNR